MGKKLVKGKTEKKTIAEILTLLERMDSRLEKLEQQQENKDNDDDDAQYIEELYVDRDSDADGSDVSFVVRVSSNSYKFKVLYLREHRLKIRGITSYWTHSLQDAKLFINQRDAENALEEYKEEEKDFFGSDYDFEVIEV